MSRLRATFLASWVALAGLCVISETGQARAGGCAGVCERPEDVRACHEGRPVWGFREPGGVCRSGSFGYLESREGADAERLRLAKSYKRRCDEKGECGRFHALDQAEVVCLACDPSLQPPLPPSSSADSRAGRAPPCGEDEWLQIGEPGRPSRCFIEFVGLPARIALRGKCTEGDCRSDVGTLKWPGGERYVGSFRNGKRHGQGTFSWPDGRMYVGEWRKGQPSGLGTRIFANGRYKAGYFDRGRYLGLDVDHVSKLAASETSGVEQGRGPSAPSCEEVCTEDAELRLSRINDEYECCFARHAFCTQKAEVSLEGCKTRACGKEARLQRDDCDLRYACDAVQTEKVARFRKGRAQCVEGCSSAGLDDQGLRVSERGTLYDE